MFPLSAVTQTMSAYGNMMPNADVVRPKALPTPGVDAPTPLEQPSEVTPGQSPSDSFGNVLGKFISDVNAKQNAATQAMDGLQSGGVPLHQAVIAMEEANVSFQLMVEVRNKLLESYQEVMKMQL
ncbi:MAG TPA: flagellar hook-basal body complex protein FliE [Candidatus Polarisedimenticolia bacterium]|nr:flagellar hook-basal body complex protein FliE [Candidatus Polarisedimenticolia bacterium]